MSFRGHDDVTCLYIPASNFNSLSSDQHRPSYYTAPESIRLLDSDSLPSDAVITSSHRSSLVNSSNFFTTGTGGDVQINGQTSAMSINADEYGYPYSYLDQDYHDYIQQESVDLTSETSREQSANLTVCMVKFVCMCSWVPCVFTPSWSSRASCYFSTFILFCSTVFLIAGCWSVYQLSSPDLPSWVLFICSATGLGLAMLVWNIMFICKWRQQGRYNQQLFENSLE